MPARGQLTPCLTAQILGDPFRGDANQRMRHALTVAAQIEAVLASIDSGDLHATETEIARLEGASLALRIAAGRGRGHRG